jgi:phosphoribosylaminoimidazolecarboxamide formyltransferase/IMP cyclohydrolase
MDRETAEEAAKLFVEAIAAPGFDPEALAVLTTKKNLRVLEMGAAGGEKPPFEPRHVAGGLLLQTPDGGVPESGWKTVSDRAPSVGEQRDLAFAWRVVKHVKSNAIVLASKGRAVGVGAGQMSRVDATKLSIQKAGEAAKGSVLASDAFFPFRDGVDAAAAAGVTAIVQPGGSVRDNETIEAANAHGIAMVFTGVRHFKH